MRFSIGKKQAVGMSIFFILMFIIGGFSLFQMKVIFKKFNFLSVRIAQMERILTSKFYLQRAKEKLWLLQLDRRDVHRYDLQHSFQSYKRYFNYFKNEVKITSSERSKITEIEAYTPKVAKLIKVYITLSEKGRWNDMTSYFKQFEVVTERVLKELDDTGRNIFDDVNEASLNNKKSMDYSSTVIITLIILFLSTGSLYVATFTKSLTKPILAVSNFAKSVALNDLTKTIGDKYIKRSDETGDLAKSVESMRLNLNDVLAEIKESSDDVHSSIFNLSKAIQDNLATVEEFSANTQSINFASQEQVDFVEKVLSSVNHINESISDIESNIKKQAVSFEDFSSMIEEMAGSIQSVARISEKASKISEGLSDVANKGSSSIREVIEAVNGIDNAGKKIFSIMNVITGIAEQTNLLAMNAAIEAAHAGEYGKGFAVVADEIRKLADTSSSSSKEIQKLLKDVAARITNAVELGNGANQGLYKIVSDISTTTTTNEEIFTATHEQTKGVKQILSSIAELIAMTKQNSDTASIIGNLIKDIKDGIDKLKLISVDMQNSTKEQSIGSNEIVKLIEKENSALEKISGVINEFESLINKFKVIEKTETKKDNSGLAPA